MQESDYAMGFIHSLKLKKKEKWTDHQLLDKVWQREALLPKEL